MEPKLNTPLILDVLESVGEILRDASERSHCGSLPDHDCKHGDCQPPVVTRVGWSQTRDHYRRTPCDSLVLASAYEGHLEDCEACKGGWSVFDKTESEERTLDDPRRGQAADINSRR